MAALCLERLFTPRAARALATDVNLQRVFDRSAKRLQRNRAVSPRQRTSGERVVACSLTPPGVGPQALDPDVQQYELLRDEVAWRVGDRIGDIKRTFPLALDLGCGRGHMGKVHAL
jgi:NADH dehydrogenase [ubiquinone] 1 alpha subcomplex assembly factor 5